AGSATADGVTVQANMMERATVWPAMLAPFTGSRAGLAARRRAARLAPAGARSAARLLAALRAAEAEGGDLRGRQSAVIVISGPPGAPAWQRDIDLRGVEPRAPAAELEAATH